jgi:hypothetical protein
MVAMSDAVRVTQYKAIWVAACRKEGTLTVIGGPHARSFPADCMRFFDWVVLERDKVLIGDLLKRVRAQARSLRLVPVPGGARAGAGDAMILGRSRWSGSARRKNLLAFGGMPGETGCL